MTWWAAAFWSTRAVGRPALGSQLTFRAFVIAGAVLLFGMNSGGRAAGAILWRPGAIASAAFVAVTIAGFAFTWWARLTIGTLWSSGVTRKADHRIVDNGPYGLVRHDLHGPHPGGVRDRIRAAHAVDAGRRGPHHRRLLPEGTSRRGIPPSGAWAGGL